MYFFYKNVKVSLDVLLFEQFDHQYPLIKTRRELLTKKALNFDVYLCRFDVNCHMLIGYDFHVFKSRFIRAYRRYDNRD